MVREILLLGNPVLRQKCERVKNFSDPTLGRIVRDLRDTLAGFRTTHGFGRGIAAPQIGVTKAIIFINIDEPIALINPEITGRSRQMMTLWDDCFSFPELMVRVRRHATVRVQFRDNRGKKQTLVAGGGLSELLQHEVDHTNGILAVDRAIDSHHIILRSEWLKLAHDSNPGFQF